MSQYWSKYRGTVVNNIDPEQRGRIQVIVPAVTGLTPSSWALPCVPVAGISEGFFAVPPLTASVWIEYEEGDPDKPVWVGGFWSQASEVPMAATAPPAIPPGQNIVIQTSLQNSIAISDSAPTPASGGITLKSTTGASIVVNDSGIYISNGKGAEITMVGPTITVNQGALVIT
jgi:uncharacterized protein involved in type VI secretion and phage assembly